MAEAVIHAEERKAGGSRASRRLRQQGMIPGVVYGHSETGLAIAVNAHDFLQTLHARARMFDLRLAGRPDEKVLVKELQYDTLTDAIIHVDLLRVDLTETVEVMVPVLLVGHAVGVVQGKGVLEQPLHEVRVRCLPLAIPNELRVSIADLEISGIVAVRDVGLPEGVAVVNAADQVVAVVHPPVAEEELVTAAAEAAGPAEPEVIGAKEKEAGEAETEGEAEKPEKRAKAEKKAEKKDE